MSLAILYSDGTQECQRAEALFQSLDQQYVEYVLDRDFTMKEFISEFGTEATFPQVAIGTTHVGSLKETLHYFKERDLLTAIRKAESEVADYGVGK